MAKPVPNQILEVQGTVTINVNVSGLNAGADSPILQQILNQLGTIAQKETTIMATLDDVVTAVAADTTIADSIATLVQQVVAKINDLAAQLAAAIASNDPVKLQAALDAANALGTNLQASSVALQSAVPANT